jgi:hypothetical protein
MKALETLEVAYKFMKFYVCHLPEKADDWSKLAERAGEIGNRGQFEAAIMIACIHEIERRVADNEQGK